MVPANKILTVAYGTFSCTLEGFDDPFSTMTDIAEYFRDLASDDRYFGAEPPTLDVHTLRQIAEAKSNQPVEAKSGENGITLRPTVSPFVPVEQNVDAEVEGIEPEMEAATTADVAQAPVEEVSVSAPDAESAAAKLARLRSVVAEENASEGFTEDQHATAANDVADAAHMAGAEAETATIADDLMGDENLETDEAIPSDQGDEQLSEDLAALFAEADTAEADTAIVEEARDLQETEVEAETAQADTPPEDLEIEEPVAEESTEEEPVAETSEEPEPVQAAEAPEDSAESPLRRLRIRKVRRSDVAAVASSEATNPADAGIDQAPEEGPAVAGADVENVAEAVEPDTPEAAPILADDDEADLMAELAAIEAELDRDSTGATTVGDDTATEVDLDDEEDVLDVAELSDDGESSVEDDLAEELAAIEAEETIDSDSDVEDDPEDLERLFAATDSRLSGEETSRRHANISHLKAAVAARRADDTMETEKTDETGAYREDLANSVRPRRAPVPAEGRTERPAPLVLVSEQRVEEDESTSSEPVTPRRTARLEAESHDAAPRSKAADPAQADDFEEFAANVGATELSEILEAAAVYSATVLEQDTFSRPRLLHLAAEAVDDLSREDGLRGFGQLLRDGTLRKVNRGTFALGEDSRFMAKVRRQAG